jgi:hypothetical protein
MDLENLHKTCRSGMREEYIVMKMYLIPSVYIVRVNGEP